MQFFALINAVSALNTTYGLLAIDSLSSTCLADVSYAGRHETRKNLLSFLPLSILRCSGTTHSSRRLQSSRSRSDTVLYSAVHSAWNSSAKDRWLAPSKPVGISPVYSIHPSTSSLLLPHVCYSSWLLFTSRRPSSHYCTLSGSNTGATNKAEQYNCRNMPSYASQSRGVLLSQMIAEYTHQPFAAKAEMLNQSQKFPRSVLYISTSRT